MDFQIHLRRTLTRHPVSSIKSQARKYKFPSVLIQYLFVYRLKRIEYTYAKDVKE